MCEVLGRKGALAEISKDMGKLDAAGRARVGKLLNAVKSSVSAGARPPGRANSKAPRWPRVWMRNGSI